jgi:UDP-N-acetylmuramoyl-tripeptide--D-alanyl-D-alanine ligase
MDIAALHKHFLASAGISTDTRNIFPGCLFVALKGANFDGNQFVADALSRGASFALCDREQPNCNPAQVGVVSDALQALQQLATFHRDYLNIPVVAVTGSNGKTTTKELLARVLSVQFPTFCTKGNLNNHIGVPLSLLSLTANHRMAVIEMGANHQKEIEALCEIAKPNYGMITNVGKAHLEGFGGIEGVIKGKSELYKYLRKQGGKLFVNADDPILSKITAGADRLTYGYEAKADVQAEIISESGDLVFSLEGVEVHSHLSGRYNLSNMLAAAAVGSYFRIPAADIAAALSSYIPDNNRSQKIKKGNTTIWLDAYNANPSSMAAALENFNTHTRGKNRMVIVGEMNELGDDTYAEHSRLLELLSNLSLTEGFVVGKKFEGHPLPKGLQAVADVAALKALCRLDENQEREVFVKGSRTNKLEEWLN